MARVIERVRLQHQDRAKNSDKVYVIELSEEDGGFRVTGYNGRRGARLTPQSKTPHPVSYRTARDIFDKLESAKLYHSQTPYRIVDRDIASRTSRDALETTPTPALPTQRATNQHMDAPAQTAGKAERTPVATDSTPESEQPEGYEPSYLDALEF